jgi:hypothetical protein
LLMAWGHEEANKGWSSRTPTQMPGCLSGTQPWSSSFLSLPASCYSTRWIQVMWTCGFKRGWCEEAGIWLLMTIGTQRDSERWAVQRDGWRTDLLPQGCTIPNASTLIPAPKLCSRKTRHPGCYRGNNGFFVY